MLRVKYKTQSHPVKRNNGRKDSSALSTTTKLKYVKIIWKDQGKQWNSIVRYIRLEQMEKHSDPIHSWIGKQYYRCPFSLN